MLIPYGLVEAEVHRTPWVSVALGSICVVVYLLGWAWGPVFPSGSTTAARGALAEIIEDGGFRPGPACQPLLGEEPVGALTDDGGGEARAARAEEVCQQLWAQADEHPQRRFAYVPARGALQLGMLTSIFLHAGLLHLLGNLLFFFVCGPFLEDLWGRPFFLAFFLVGGAGAALAQGAVDEGSYVGMVGASGAIAACMGAMTFRYPKRHVKMLLLFWFMFRPVVHRFTMKVWLWGGLWVAWEILQQALGGQAGVATMAHIGGFGVGVAVVLGLKHSGVEKRVLMPAVDKAQLLVDNVNEKTAEADAALDEGRPQEAARRYEQALREDPLLEEAMWGAARAHAAAGHDEGERRAVVRLARHFVGRKDAEGALELVDLYGTGLSAGLLPATVLGALADVVEPRSVAAAKTLRRGAPPSSSGSASSGGAADAEGGAPAAGGLAAPAEGPGPSLVAVHPARFAGVGPAGVQVEVAGLVKPLSPPQVEAVAVGMVGGRLVVDLRLRAGSDGRVTVLRMRGDSMGLEHFGPPGAPPAEVFAKTMTSLLSASGAKAVPSPEACTRGPFATFPDVEAFEQAAYRTSLSS